MKSIPRVTMNATQVHCFSTLVNEEGEKSLQCVLFDCSAHATLVFSFPNQAKQCKVALMLIAMHVVALGLFVLSVLRTSATPTRN